MEFHSYSEKCPFSSIEDINGKSVTIMGLGLNGGGEAAVRFFLKHGAKVLVTDMKPYEELKATVEKLKNDKELNLNNLTFRLGQHLIEDFENAHCVIKNPGVKYQGNKYLAAAKYIESDLSIFLRFTKCPIIAVTGSKGKSSTVSAIHYGLCQAGFDCFLGGNITVSPLTFFDKVNEKTPVVIEFSSWQLSDLRGRKLLKPYISLITKIVPDHQNWYGNMENYITDKKLIYANQDENDYSIFDSDEWGDLFAKESKANIIRYNENSEPIKLGDLLVPGKHMRSNAENAALVMKLMGVEENKIINILQSWPGISHRLQYFHSWKNKNNINFKFYNDSASTVPESAAAASQAFEKPVILLTGGTDKGLDMNLLSNTLCNKDNNQIKTKKIFLLAGSATDKILASLKENNISFKGPFNSLEELLEELHQYLQSIKESSYKDEIVVFSPGATSFGMFNNEFDRGDKFIKGIKDLF